MSRNLKSEIEEFRTAINRIVEALEEVSNSSKTIPETVADELSRKFESLMDGCEDVSSQLNTSIEMLDGIRSRWG